MHREAQLFERTQKLLQPVGELQGRGRICQKKRSAHKQNDAKHHQHRAADAVIGDAQHPERADHIAV